MSGSTKFKGPLFMVAAMFAFSSMGALVKVSCTQIPSAEVVFFRGIIGFVILAVVAWKKKISVKGNRRGLLFARAMAGGIALFMFFFALGEIPVAEAMLLNQATPIFVLPLAALILKEKITARHVAWVILALVGATVVINPTADTLGVKKLGSILALCSAFGAAIAYVLVRKLTKTEHTLTIVLWFTGISTLITIPVMIPGFVWPGPVMLLALTGVALTALAGQLLLTFAYRHGEAGRLAVIGSTGAILGAGWDVLIWSHLPDIWTVVGGVIVITSCSMIQMMRDNKN